MCFHSARCFFVLFLTCNSGNFTSVFHIAGEIYVHFWSTTVDKILKRAKITDISVLPILFLYICLTLYASAFCLFFSFFFFKLLFKVNLCVEDRDWKKESRWCRPEGITGLQETKNGILRATGEKIQAVKVLVKLIWLYQIVFTIHFSLNWNTSSLFVCLFWSTDVYIICAGFKSW